MASRDIAVDRLPEAGSSLEVVLLEDARFGSDSDCGPRRPHRHDYHELVWTRSGTGRHLIDGEVSLVDPNTITLIGRGRVHVLERARGLNGALVRFGEELLHGDPATGANPAWLVGNRSVQTVGVPGGEVARLEALIELLAAETRRPPDSHSVALQRHFLSALLVEVVDGGFEVRDPWGTALAVASTAPTGHRRRAGERALTGHRDGGGHGLTQPAGDALRASLAERIA